MNRRHPRFRNPGFSLVELMVAITIGLMITAAIATVFMNTKRGYTTQDRIARLQENGRFAMDYIVRDLRLAGYLGCVEELIENDTFQNNLAGGGGPPFNAAIALEGLDNSATGSTWYPSGNAVLPAGIKTGTDAVTIRMVDPTSMVSLRSPMPNTSAELKVDSVAGLADNDIVMLADCANADLFQITSVQTASLSIQHRPGEGSPGNRTPHALSKRYGTSAKLLKFTGRTYYVAPGASGIPSLFLAENGKAPAELVEGIEDLQLTYGEDTDMPPDDIPNVYRPASSVSNWGRVVSARVAILARTTAAPDGEPDTNKYVVNDVEITRDGSDSHRRRVFNTTVVLRNLFKAEVGS